MILYKKIIDLLKDKYTRLENLSDKKSLVDWINMYEKIMGTNKIWCI